MTAEADEVTFDQIAIKFTSISVSLIGMNLVPIEKSSKQLKLTNHNTLNFAG